MQIDFERAFEAIAGAMVRALRTVHFPPHLQRRNEMD